MKRRQDREGVHEGGLHVTHPEHLPDEPPSPAAFVRERKGGRHRGRPPREFKEAGGKEEGNPSSKDKKNGNKTSAGVAVGK